MAHWYLHPLQNNDHHKWLCAPYAIYKTDAVKGAPERRGCARETRVDILKRIADWAADASSPPIFWLSGLAGTGKTTIAYTVCDQFDKEGLPARLCASFFCSRQVEDLRQLGNIIPTLAYQLACFSRSFSECLVNADRVALHVSKEQMEKLFVDPWKQSANSRSGELPLSLIVIDALDEIEGDGGEKLLTQLLEATTKAKGGIRGLKILVTSRPHPRIVDATSPIPSDAVYHLEDIADGQADVRKYFSEELRELEASCKQGLDDLATLSDGLFIFAATAARLISPRKHTYSTKQKAKRLSVILHGDHTLASDGKSILGIDTLYAQIIRDAIPEDYPPWYLSVLHNIVCTLQPLPIPVHAELVATNFEDKDDEAVEHFIGALHSVVYVRDGRVYTYHKSFTDFVIDPNRCEPSLACVPEVQHAFISRGCIRIMEASLRFNICNLPSSYLFDSEVENLKDLVDLNIRSKTGLEYACRYWTSHLIEVSPTSEKAQDLRAALTGFREEKILFWIEVMNLLSAKDACYDGVNAVMSWVNHAVSYNIAMAILFPDVRWRTGSGRIRRNRAADCDERSLEACQIIPTYSNVAIDTSSLHYRLGDGIRHKSPNLQPVAVSLPRRSPNMLRWCEQPWRSAITCRHRELCSLSCIFPRWYTRRLGLV
jgi:hypothetical protein